jgi:ATP-binding cassette, subfamily B, bacterial HlyB/CyaB
VSDRDVAPLAPRNDAGLASLAVVARLHGKALDPEQLRHELAIEGAASAEHLLRAARRSGFKAVLDTLDLRRARVPLPCIVELANGAGFAVLAKIEGARALIHADGRPQTLELEALQEKLSGRALFITTRAASPLGLARFGFGWFIPAIARYKKLIGEALVASLALQVFALLTPLFFQVIVDKVLVHKGLSTLTVIATGLLAAVLFESVLSALRTYVLAHTTSRIDVELGSRLFRHLLALPLAYFESRRVGDTVARVRELENIRQFLTGPALMSIIDLAFAGVFIAVMLYYSPLLTLVVLVPSRCTSFSWCSPCRSSGGGWTRSSSAVPRTRRSSSRP